MSDATILVVEDEPDINHILCVNLRKDGHRVLSAASGEAGLKLARRRRPDLAVLDIMLPRMDGLELMRALHREFPVPVLFLTAKKDEIDRILGLKFGAEDYLTKPFSVGELSARVQAILRRRGRASSARRLDGAPLSVGRLVVDFERHEARVGGRLLRLSPREFRLLRVMAAAEGRVLSRERLMEGLWDGDSNVDPRTVDQHVARLRKKLLSERGLIVTVNNFGYQLRIAAAPAGRKS